MSKVSMLVDEFQKAGNWLFRWRSYLPLVLVVLAIPAAQDSVCRAGVYPTGTTWEILCLTIALLGLVVRVLTVGYVPAGTSGRNTLKQVAATLNATGMYSVVRHPIYLGNFLMWLGVALLPRCWWFTLITVLIFWLYYERIMFAEEGFLLEQFGEQYRDWAARTPAFIPKFSNWVRPNLPFSLKSAISREYSTLFTIIALFTLFNLIIAWFSRGIPVPDRFTVTVFVIGLLIYGTIRYVKKRTDLLRTEGR
jgi:protein-S-isoprenylcysteine O-methyltransferase Ste14